MTEDHTYTSAEIYAGIRANMKPKDLAAADREFAALEDFWRNPAPHKAAKIEGQKQINALFAPHEAGILALKQAEWDREGE